MILRKSLMHPNTFAVELDEGKTINDRILDNALALVINPEQDEIEIDDVNDEPVTNVEPLVPPSLYEGQGDVSVDNHLDENLLVPPVMNFDSPKAKEQGTERAVSNEEDEPLAPPTMDY